MLRWRMAIMVERLPEPGKQHHVVFTKSGVHFDIDEDTPLLVAGKKAGLELPFFCVNGVCRSCRQNVRGEIWGRKRTLTPEETAQGLALLCVSQARSDLEIDA